ncbi:Glycosyl transferases group 1 [Nakamurella panacisegetis]|uniref:Glycosyl transferases group 1 n=1 Tax=Nakamurella panacisegetis TaxID=1090615 RepID=A0A1H0IKP0_9ACTN|nr:glycosyltransferase [Nakamurella panacisegetis]SDO31953.1 Glycosyl transferases group 1 [Nakamurella panacisegetis]
MSDRTRFVFLHSSDELYGADRMLLEMVGALPEHTEAEVWLPTDLAHPERPLCVELERRGAAVRHLDLPIMRRAYQNPMGLVRLAVRSARLFRALRRGAPDVVYCTTSATFLGAPLARIARVPAVIGHLQEIWSKTDRQVLRGPALACHRLLAISEAVVASVPGRIALRTVVVPNGTPEPPRLVPIETHQGRLQFVVASRWNAWKGHRTLLAAWDRAKPAGHLTVLGGRPPSGEWVDVPGLVSALRDPSSVSVVGEVSDPSVYLEEADVVLMPSDEPEPFGLVAIEAFARGRPVVASAGGGLVDVVTDQVDGWLYPPGDVAALAAILGRLSRTEVTEAGHQARETYKSRFNTERFALSWRAATFGERSTG